MDPGERNRAGLRTVRDLGQLPGRGLVQAIQSAATTDVENTPGDDARDDHEHAHDRDDVHEPQAKGCIAETYADNWFFTTGSYAQVRRACEITAKMLELADLRALEPVCWSAAPDGAAKLSGLRISDQDVELVTSYKMLGPTLSFDGKPCAAALDKRLAKSVKNARRLCSAPLPFEASAAAGAIKIIPSIVHGCEVAPVARYRALGLSGLR